LKSYAVDLRAINRALFTNAKRLWAAAVAVKLGAFAVGVAGTLGVEWHYVPQALLLLAVGAEVLQQCSDHVKGQGESLLRTLDLCRSFGRSISDADRRDIVMVAPRRARAHVRDSPSLEDTYFASAEPAGPRRAVKNLIESAWYTRHQAQRMKSLYLALFAVLITTSVFALIAANREINAPQHREQVIKVVTAWLMLIVSLSMLRSPLAYYRLEQRCTRTEMTCGHLLNGDVSESDAMKQWYEHQLGRSAAPLLPDWLWNMLSPRLDVAWRAQGS
jgi:hypothetical protein